MKTQTETHSPDRSLATPLSWQAHLWSRLTTQITEGRLPHALMFAGEQGIGKSQLGLSLAQYLLCQAPRMEIACGRCKACELNLAGTHPDLMVLEPEEDKRWIRIDQVRVVTEFVAKTAQQGGRKVVLLNPAEALNPNSANALLKSLEEPAGNTHIILICHRPGAVLATIRSRCVVISQPVPPIAQALAWLKPLATGHDPEQLLQRVGGAPIRALQLLEGDLLERCQKFEQGLLDIAYSDRSPVAVAAEFSGDSLIDYVDVLLGWLQKGCILKASASDTAAVGRADSLVQQVGQLPQSAVFSFLDRLLEMKRQLLGGANPNRQLLLEELMLQWQAATGDLS